MVIDYLQGDRFFRSRELMTRASSAVWLLASAAHELIFLELFKASGR